MYKTDDDMLARATIETWVIKAEKGEQNCCPKCDGKVFEAEKMVTASVIIYSLTNFCAILYTGAKKYSHPYYINTIEMRSL